MIEPILTNYLPFFQAGFLGATSPGLFTATQGGFSPIGQQFDAALSQLPTDNDIFSYVKGGFVAGLGDSIERAGIGMVLVALAGYYLLNKR